MRVLAKKYSKELKEAVMRRMLPPENASVSYLEKETGISRMTLYGWRDEALGRVRRPVKESSSEDRSSREKFLVVWETYALNEAQLGEYCRTKGLYVEEVWWTPMSRPRERQGLLRSDRHGTRGGEVHFLWSPVAQR